MSSFTQAPLITAFGLEDFPLELFSSLLRLFFSVPQGAEFVVLTQPPFWRSPLELFFKRLLRQFSFKLRQFVLVTTS